jgi:general secretion pathway protein D
MGKFLIKKVIFFILLCLAASCATVPTQESAPAAHTAPQAPAVQQTPAHLSPAPLIPANTLEVEDEAPPEPRNTVRRGTGVFIWEGGDDEQSSYLHAINLVSLREPYPAADLPRHEAFQSYRTYIVPYRENGTTWYRLRLGFFENREAALAVQSGLQKAFPGSWVTRVSPEEKKLSVAAAITEPARLPDQALEPEGDVTLNFEQANLREFLRVVFEEILKVNYLIDSQVNGTVTLHTTSPVTQDAVLPIVESVLQQNGAAVVYQQGLYKVIPLADAPAQVDSPVIGRQPASRGSGFVVQIVPLRFIAAAEIEKIITPSIPKGGSVRVDETRNLLILSGPRYSVDQIMETIKIFDVDWLRGMSFGLFRLQYAPAGTLVVELEKLIGEGGAAPLTGIVRMVPIERLNAILVISHAPRYLDELSKLIEEFDQGAEGLPGSRLYVYHLKNSKAENIAGVLQQIYGLGEDRRMSLPSPRIAQLPPGEGGNFFRTAEELSEPPPPLLAGTGAGGGYPRVAPLTGPEAGMTPRAISEDDGASLALGFQSNVNIIADRENNALLIMASKQDYRGIEAVIRELDVPPRQVLIDATIAEVTLSNDLDYGVRWFLRQNNLSLGLNAPVPSVAAGEGLALAVFKDNGNARLFIDTLAAKTNVKFLSAPQVMVLDNQTANIRVGDQIPVTVRSSQSTIDPDAPIVTEVQFRDTGTLLSVRPRITAGGQVTMDITQEVSLPGTEAAVGGGGNVAISQRTIDSSVIVSSGETVVLGGLILETRNDTKSGIPLLMDLPLLGALFSTTSENVFRTELIVMITPQVIEDENAAQAITDELRRKMKRAVDYGNSVKEIDL